MLEDDVLVGGDAAECLRENDVESSGEALSLSAIRPSKSSSI